MNRIEADELSEVVPVWGVHSLIGERTHAHAWTMTHECVYETQIRASCGLRDVVNSWVFLLAPGDTPRCKRCERAANKEANT